MFLFETRIVGAIFYLDVFENCVTKRPVGSLNDNFEYLENFKILE